MNGKGGVGEYDVRYIRMIATSWAKKVNPWDLGPTELVQSKLLRSRCGFT